MRSLIPWRRNSNGVAVDTGEVHPIARLRNEMDTLFDHFFGDGWLTPFRSEREQGWNWGFGMQEEDDHLLIRAELPGFEPEEIDVQLHGQQLVIQAEKKQVEEGEKEEKSRWVGTQQVTRSLTLPEEADFEKAEASYRNGVLEIRLPRSETRKPHRIEVKA